MKFLALLLFPLSLFSQKTIVVEDNETEPITYIGSHRKVGDNIILKLGVNESNQAYGYLEISGKRDSLARPWAGGEVINDDFNFFGKFVQLELNNCHLSITGFRTDQIKVEYFQIEKRGLKPYKFKMERAEQ